MRKLLGQQAKYVCEKKRKKQAFGERKEGVFLFKGHNRPMK